MRLICIVLVALICGTVPALAQLLSVDNLYDRVQERFADNNGVPIQYVVTGQGPLVLFIHGYPDQWFTWRHQMVALADTYTVAAISQRGYNKSGRPKGVEQYAISHLTADVAAVMRHLGRQQATIVGHDWGGIVAWHFAQQHPEMVKGLVVFNNPHPRTRWRELASNKEQQDKSAYIAQFTTTTGDLGGLDAERLATQRAVGTPWYAHYVEAYRRSDREAMLNFYRAYYGAPPWQVDRSPVVKIQVPVLEFHGLDDTAYVRQSLNDTWDYLEKDFTLITLPGVGHNSPYTGPIDYVNRALTSWLELKGFNR